MAPAGHAERIALLAAAWFPGQAPSVGHARDFVRGVLGHDCPVLNDVVLMTSEIATNAVLHTASGRDGGWFDLTISVTRKAVRVAVADRGGSSEPGIPNDSRELDAGELTGGRGLWMVNALASS